MVSLTDTAEDLLVDHVLGTSTFTVTTPIQVALMTANGSDSSAGTEVSGGTYARQDVTFAAASGGSASNDATITFPGMPDATVVGVELYDSSATPRRLAHAALAESRTVNAGDDAKFNPGELTFEMD